MADDGLTFAIGGAILRYFQYPMRERGRAFMRLFKIVCAILAGLAGAVRGFAGEQFLAFPGGASALYWAERSVEEGDPEAEYAVIFVHGLHKRPRDLSPMFKSLIRKDPRSRKVVFAMPAYFSPKNCPPALKGKIALWDTGRHNWTHGDPSFGEAKIGSFEVIDRLYEAFSDRARYPKLKHILLCGFSAGGQVVNRYIAVGNFVRQSHLDYSFAVGAPSTYLYVDGRRPTADGSFRVPEPAVPGCDSWHMGLEKRNAYAAKLSKEEILANFASRPTLYFCGEADVLPRGMYATPAAMTQGENRYKRFLNYRRYIALFPEWNKQCRFVTVPKYGHALNKVCAAPEFLKLIFGERE